MKSGSKVAFKKLNFKTLFEAVPGLYLVLTPDLHVVAGSDSYLNATKTLRKQVMGRYLFDVFPDNPEDRNATGVSNLRASLLRVLEFQKPDVMAVQKYDIQRPSYEGGGYEERYWNPINSPVFDNEGHVAYIIHRVEDVTDFIRMKQSRTNQEKITEDLKAQAEKTEAEIYVRAQELQNLNEQLRQSNISLARKERELSQARNILQAELATGQKDLLTLANELALRKKELQKTMDEMRLAKDEALRASQVKSQFLANMSHEIRTPLGIILGFTDLLREPSLSRTERDDFLNRIHASGQHLLELISEILDLTKIESGHVDIEYSPMNVSQLLEEIRSLLEPLAKEKGLAFKVAQGAELPLVFKSDHTKIRQILINLVSNAIKFCSHGSVELRTEIDITHGSPEISFLIQDSGPGIEKSYSRRLFEEFSQADNSMTRPHGGSGLGLALSRKLARILGGDVELVHTDSHGTTFRARFPLSLSEETQPLIAKSTQENVHLEKVRILAVDDVPANLELVKRILEKAGAVVETAANGAEGMEKALAAPFDLILMDIQMPQMNGYEAIAHLREKGYVKPIIALTAHALKEDREKCMESGCNDYLSKPIMQPVLLQAIRKNLSDFSTPEAALLH